MRFQIMLMKIKQMNMCKNIFHVITYTKYAPQGVGIDWKQPGVALVV